MGDKIIENRWGGSTGFLIAMIGAIIGLSGIWKFSYLMYENGGGKSILNIYNNGDYYFNNSTSSSDNSRYSPGFNLGSNCNLFTFTLFKCLMSDS